ncbi:MAG: hypothetical protein TUN42_00490 [Dehalogenimonas sp.]
MYTYFAPGVLPKWRKVARELRNAEMRLRRRTTLITRSAGRERDREMAAVCFMNLSKSGLGFFAYREGILG